jgi:hypothetical protein
MGRGNDYMRGGSGANAGAFTQGNSGSTCYILLEHFGSYLIQVCYLFFMLFQRKEVEKKYHKLGKNKTRKALEISSGDYYIIIKQGNALLRAMHAAVLILKVK